MQPPEAFVRIVGQRRYSTATATLLASDAYWDGHNFERRGRNTFLYRTSHRAFFVVTLSQWQGERDTLTPIPEDEAMSLYENDLSEHEVTYEEAFPGVVIENA